MGCRTLIEMFGGPSKVLAVGLNDLAQASGVPRKVMELIASQPPYREAEAELKRTREHGITLLSWDNPAYPKALRSIYNPPMLLFVRGDVSQLNRPAIAVVGSRAATSYGLKIARRLGAELAGHGLTVVSGLALGIDAGAHTGALEARGSTVAVLGCGVDVPYPRRNVSLAGRIADNGALISEYAMGTQPDAFRFPARNRIISGLALGVVVVEAAARSGSLITARLAMEEGREVFAIPGRVDSSKSAGAHKLLQDGAKLVYRVEDIFEELSVPLASFATAATSSPPKVAKAAIELNAAETKIMAVLDEYPQHFEIIVNKTGLSAQNVTESLLLLELQGQLESLPGQQYRAK
jgi:DNA processing protein